MKRTIASMLLAGLVAATTAVQAEEYVIDTQKAHAFIQFRIQHLGFSWLYGRFNDFTGNFSYDEKTPSAAKVSVEIDPASVDTNHAERDKHLRSDDFFHVDKYPAAKFVSTSFTQQADGSAEMKGELTLRGVTKPVVVAVVPVGHGDDPWGGYRRGFFGTTEIALADFGIPFDLGPAGRKVHLELSVEGIRQ